MKALPKAWIMYENNPTIPSLIYLKYVNKLCAEMVHFKPCVLIFAVAL
jgi:hypothetical protein